MGELVHRAWSPGPPIGLVPLKTSRGGVFPESWEGLSSSALDPEKSNWVFFSFTHAMLSQIPPKNCGQVLDLLMPVEG